MEKSPLQNFTYGLFFVTAKYRKKDSGCVTNTAIQVTSQPEQISIALNNASFTNEMIKQSEMFNVSVMNQNVDFELIKRFGFQTGRNIEKFENFKGMERSKNGIYYIKEGTNSFISVKITETIDIGTHTMFVGKITEMEILNNIKSATYEFYQNHIKPKPKLKSSGNNSDKNNSCRRNINCFIFTIRNKYYPVIQICIMNNNSETNTIIINTVKKMFYHIISCNSRNRSIYLFIFIVILQDRNFFDRLL